MNLMVAFCPSWIALQQCGFLVSVFGIQVRKIPKTKAYRRNILVSTLGLFSPFPSRKEVGS